MSEDRGNLKQKNLYEILGIEKSSTDDDIKRAYRKLALKFHPDKNRDGDPVKTEKFKEINHAHAILSNPQKRKIYDDYGEIGLKMADQFGEERMTVLLRPWVKWVFCTVAILTCGCFGCCCCFLCYCQCCCNFCCGKFKPQTEEGYSNIPKDNSQDNVITSQPGSSSGNGNGTSSQPQPNAPIVLGPPPSTMNTAESIDSNPLPQPPSNPNYGATKN